jgi:hypothetical protein
LRQAGVVIVTNPGLKKISQDNEAVQVRFSFQQIIEGGFDFRRGLTQMEIADKKTVHGVSASIVDDGDTLDDDGLHRYILMTSLTACLYAPDFV